MRAENRKQEERRKQDMMTRNRVLSAILDKVAAPITKADLEFVVREYASSLSQEHRNILAQRHLHTPAKGKDQKSIEIASTLKNLDETGYTRLLIEISLLDAAYNSYAQDSAERLETVAKRYRVNIQKIKDSVAAEFTARRKKREQRQKTGAHSTTTRKVRKGTGA